MLYINIEPTVGLKETSAGHDKSGRRAKIPWMGEKGSLMKQTPKRSTRAAARRARQLKLAAISAAGKRGWKVEVKPSGEVVIRR